MVVNYNFTILYKFVKKDFPKDILLVMNLILKVEKSSKFKM